MTQMKKYIFFYSVLFLASGALIAQSQNLKKANKLFSKRSYTEAIVSYEKLERTQEVLQNLADSYLYTNQLTQAVTIYKELNETYDIAKDDDLQFRYGHALKGIEMYTNADKIFSAYFGTLHNSNEFMEEIKKTTPHDFELTALHNENGHNDFGMSFFGKDRVVFASSRNEENPIYAWNNLPYLDLYSASLSNDNQLSDVTAFPNEINTNSHESNATFSSDGNIMYFNRTSNTRHKDGDLKVANIKIYRSEMIDGTWTNLSALPFTSDSYNTEHPSLSKDGKTLYFSSDMPGSIGSFDIFKVAVNEDGTYGTPENLGVLVNTAQREQFPFISDINTLYFSSNGHQGYGGLDVFRSDNINGSFVNILNLGTPANSPLDDFSFVIKEIKNNGYVSSNRSGEDQLFAFTRKDNDLANYLVEGIVMDKNSKELLSGSLITLFDENKQVLQDTIVNNDAYYKFKIEPNKKYSVRGTRKLYIPYEVDFSTDKDGKVSHNIYLLLEPYEDAEERISKNEQDITQVNLEKIFFDYDKWNIREDAAIILNTLTDLMKKYPDMEIEVASHTDARGSNDYNLALSKKRATSTMDYIVSQGIDRNRLRSIGYGEEQPLNHCVKEEICDDKEYDINRRSEFTLIN